MRREDPGGFGPFTVKKAIKSGKRIVKVLFDAARAGGCYVRMMDVALFYSRRLLRIVLVTYGPAITSIKEEQESAPVRRTAGSVDSRGACQQSSAKLAVTGPAAFAYYLRLPVFCGGACGTGFDDAPVLL